MSVLKKPWSGRLGAIPFLVAAVASIVGIGFSPQAASAATYHAPSPRRRVDHALLRPRTGFGSILAVLTSPLGPVRSCVGHFVGLGEESRRPYPVWRAGLPDGVERRHRSHLPEHLRRATLRGDAQGTTYSFSGTIAVSGCDNSYVGIQPEPDPDGGYLTFTNSAAVTSNGPTHAFDQPSFLVLDSHAPIVGAGALYNGSNVDSYYFAAADGGSLRSMHPSMDQRPE